MQSWALFHKFNALHEIPYTMHVIVKTIEFFWFWSCSWWLGFCSGVNLSIIIMHVMFCSLSFVQSCDHVSFVIKHVKRENSYTLTTSDIYDSLFFCLVKTCSLLEIYHHEKEILQCILILSSIIVLWIYFLVYTFNFLCSFVIKPRPIRIAAGL